MKTIRLEIQASDLTATEWDDQKSKLRFAKQFAKFVTGGFKWEDFPKWFYVRLSMTFGHIAHYNQHGFYATFFQDDNGKIDFVRTTLLGGGYGDPAFTFSDVEKILKKWMDASQVLEQIHVEAHKVRVKSEREVLQRLATKYGGEDAPQVLELLHLQQ